MDPLKPGAPLLITEFGWTTAATPYRKTQVTEAQQAAYLPQAVEALQANPRVRAAIWFNLQDNPGWPAGLLREDGTPKPAWGELALDVKDAEVRGPWLTPAPPRTPAGRGPADPRGGTAGSGSARRGSSAPPRCWSPRCASRPSRFSARPAGRWATRRSGPGADARSRPTWPARPGSGPGARGAPGGWCGGSRPRSPWPWRGPSSACRCARPGWPTTGPPSPASPSSPRSAPLAAAIPPWRRGRFERPPEASAPPWRGSRRAAAPGPGRRGHRVRRR